VNTVIEQRPDRVPMTLACEVLGLNRSTVYRRCKAAAVDTQGVSIPKQN
jgi:predicted DNA-binding transcriptional regulator AlpA